MSYLDKLRDPRWQRKRLEIMQRDNFKCSCCSNQSKNLQVHHLEYFSSLMPWEYSNDMLVTLCEECHGKEQHRFKHEQYFISTLKVNGFLADDLIALSCMINTYPKFKKFIFHQIEMFRNG